MTTETIHPTPKQKTKAVAYMRRYNARKAAGLCPHCGEVPEAPVFCRRCLDKINASYRARRARARVAKPRREFKVTWKRVGHCRRTKVFQTEGPARRWALIVQGRIAEATGLDPNAEFCCNGWECSCGGISNGVRWSEESKNVPALEHGPVIESRTVGAWEEQPCP